MMIQPIVIPSRSEKITCLVLMAKKMAKIGGIKDKNP
jgi:hypothetical protein